MLAGRAGILAACSGMVIWTSCSAVMEDRRECPCNLSVELKGLPAYPAALLVNGSVAGEALGDTTLTVWVQTGGTATVTAVSGAVPSLDGAVRIPYGEASAPLYVFRADVDCTGESAFVRVRMQKQFCTLNLYFKGLAEGCAPSVRPVSMTLRGSVNGFSLMEGEPLPGAFRCQVQGASARVPRQRPGDPLWLDIVLKDSVLRSFPLGTYLEEAGYDWTAPDLPDRDLEIDISVTSIHIQSGTGNDVRELTLVI